MTKEKLNIPADFFKQFKSAAYLEDYFIELYKEDVRMFQAKME